ncbi:hypothetical protein GCM10028801_37850 [Nocardioides maradonensis]
MSDTNGENTDNPYGQPNNPDPYGGAPQSNPYGSVPPPSPYTPPPTNPYGAPQYNPSSVPSYGGGPQYGGPQYGGSGYPGAPAKTDGLAIGALVASILGFCTCVGFVVGIVLGIIGLGRTKDGRAGGRGFAIAGIVIGAIGLVLSIVGGVVVALVGINQIVTPSSAKPGQCVNLSKSGDTVTMTKKSCTSSHDAEIVATATLDGSNLTAAKQNGSGFCTSMLSQADRQSLISHGGLTLRLVTENPDDMQVGDHVVCYVEGSSKLTSDVLN